MRHFVETLISLGSSDYKRSKKLRGVAPRTVERWRRGLNAPNSRDLVTNPVLAHAIARDADEFEKSAKYQEYDDNNADDQYEEVARSSDNAIVMRKLKEGATS